MAAIRDLSLSLTAAGRRLGIDRKEVAAWVRRLGLVTSSEGTSNGNAKGLSLDDIERIRRAIDAGIRAAS